MILNCLLCTTPNLMVCIWESQWNWQPIPWCLSVLRNEDACSQVQWWHFHGLPILKASVYTPALSGKSKMWTLLSPKESLLPLRKILDLRNWLYRVAAAAYGSLKKLKSEATVLILLVLDAPQEIHPRSRINGSFCIWMIFCNMLCTYSGLLRLEIWERSEKWGKINIKLRR